MEQQLIHTAWFESPTARLSQWREFRKGLDTDNTQEGCNTVIDWWKMAPLSKMTINPVDSNTWPTPWEMLHSGDFCESSLALGMSYTIYYANETIANELLYVTDKKNSTQKLCAWINNKYLLNYEHGAISTLPTENVSISFRKKIADVIKC